MEKPQAAPENAPKSDQLAASHDRWESFVFLPCALSVELKVPGVTIGDLLDLEPGSIINSRHPSSNPLPIWVNEVTIGWAEFDVVGKRLAVRITEVQ